MWSEPAGTDGELVVWRWRRRILEHQPEHEQLVVGRLARLVVELLVVIEHWVVFLELLVVSGEQLVVEQLFVELVAEQLLLEQLVLQRFVQQCGVLVLEFVVELQLGRWGLEQQFEQLVELGRGRLVEL